MRLAALAAYNQAGPRAARQLFWAAASVVVAIAAVGAGGVQGVAAAMRLGIAAALLVLAAGFGCAALLDQARGLALRGQDRAADAGPGAAARLLRRAGRRAGWQQAALAGTAGALGTLAAAIACTGRGIGPGGDAATPALTAGLAVASLIGAFGLLVVERHLAATAPDVAPDAPGLAMLSRLPVAVLLLDGVGGLLLYGGVAAGAYAGLLAAALCVLVAAEITIRALATLFVPFPPLSEARPVARSVLAGALVLRRPRPVAATVRDWFGIDLSRSWAIAFVRAAAAPVLAVLVLFGWALSGVEALRVDQRAIYERLGRPVAVFGPGLHAFLPWPLGRLRRMELGVLHDVPITFNPADAGGPALASLPDAEALPGPSEDRLWDETHPSEASYLVASLSRGRQSFESVNIDLRVVYRVGLGDASALAAAYAAQDPQKQVQARASRLLAHYFARHTLAGVLGADRASFSRDIGSALQAELDAVPAGLEVMAVVVEAIHPPPGAAAAYHAVQTAAIGGHTAIAEGSGYAVSRESDAQRQAGTDADSAAALAHEVVADADARSTGFAADRAADAAGPVPFLLERRLDRLVAGLAHRRLLVVDHRLGGPGAVAPFIDLRAGEAGTAPTELAPPPDRAASGTD